MNLSNAYLRPHGQGVLPSSPLPLGLPRRPKQVVLPALRHVRLQHWHSRLERLFAKQEY